MDDLNIQVLQGFGIRAKRIIKEKSYYICNTNMGYRVIKKSFDTSDNIAFQHKIKEHLYSLGFINTDRYYLSNYKKPYVEYDNNNYVMTDLFDYREADFSDNREFEQIIKNVALMHKFSKGIDFNCKVNYGNDNVVDLYKKNIIELTNIKKRINNQRKFSDFDVLFIKNYKFYLEQLQDAVELLEKSSLKKYIKKAKTQLCICHNLLKEENILLDGEIMYILNFSQSYVGYSLFDIVSLIQRYLKYTPIKRLSIYNIFDIYDKYNPLEKEEIEIIYPLLKYPNKFIKLCSQYYSKKRTWTPSAITNRMENIVNTRDYYYSYLESLLNPFS